MGWYEVQKTFPAAANWCSCGKGKGDLQQNTEKLLMWPRACQVTSALCHQLYVFSSLHGYYKASGCTSKGKSLLLAFLL